MAKLELKRIDKLDDRTLGSLNVYSDENHTSFCTLELPYKDNQRNISCIPCGKYKVTKRFSEKYGIEKDTESKMGRFGGVAGLF